MTADSDGVLPAWLPVSAPRIDPDRVPHSLENPTASGVLWQASRDALLMEIPDVARLVATREGLTLAPMVDIPLKTLGPVLRQTPLAALCWFHGFFARQGVALAGPDGAVVILGETITGKSTLAAILMKRGLRLLCDDLVPLALPDDGVVQVMPLWPELVLWPEAVAHVFPEESPTWLRRREGNLYGVPYWSVGANRFQDKPVALKAIYCLRRERQRDAAETEQIGGMQGLLSGALMPYHEAIGAGLGVHGLALRFHGAISARMPFQVVRLPGGGPDELDGIAQGILDHCGWNGHV